MSGFFKTLADRVCCGVERIGRYLFVLVLPQPLLSELV